MIVGMQKQNIHACSLTVLGNENEHFLDKLCAFLLALSPILQHYIGVYKNAGFTALLLVFPVGFVAAFLQIELSKD